MRIGVPKEIKVHEYRVGLVPAAVRELVAGLIAAMRTTAMRAPASPPPPMSFSGTRS